MHAFEAAMTNLPTPEEMAPRLYAAFAKARDWRDPAGFEMPPWSRTMDKERACWVAAAREAAVKYEQVARFAISERDTAVLARHRAEKERGC